MRYSIVAAMFSVAQATLYGYTILKYSDKVNVGAVAYVDLTSGNVTWSTPSQIFPSDAFCNAVFNPTLREYYVPGYVHVKPVDTRQYIITLDANGTVRNNVTMDASYSLIATSLDAQTGAVLAVAIQNFGKGLVDLLSINPRNGSTTVLAGAVPIPDVQYCGAVFGPASPSHCAGLLYYTWTDLSSPGDPEMLSVLDVAAGRVLANMVLGNTSLRDLSVWAASGRGEAVLASSYGFTHRPTELISVDPLAGTMQVVASAGQDRLDFIPLGQAHNAVGELLYSLGTRHPSNGTDPYPVLLTYNLTTSPVPEPQETRLLQDNALMPPSYGVFDLQSIDWADDD